MAKLLAVLVCDMSLVRLQRVQRRRMWVLVVVCVTGFLLGAGVSHRQESGRLQSAWSERGMVGGVALRLREPRLPVIVTVTAYSLTPEETDATPFISRCGAIHPRGVPAGGGVSRG